MKTWLKGFLSGFAFKVVVYLVELFSFRKLLETGSMDNVWGRFVYFWSRVSSPFSNLYKKAFVDVSTKEDGRRDVLITQFEIVMLLLMSWLFYPVVFMLAFILFYKLRWLKQIPEVQQ